MWIEKTNDTRKRKNNNLVESRILRPGDRRQMNIYLFIKRKHSMSLKIVP